ncbi:MAG: LPP20 family lipoprotein [Sulfurimonas sp.]|nr:LPP20 family lipoprotein [Sulfurimonas sp.]
MKYYLLLVALLSASMLFGIETQPNDSSTVNSYTQEPLVIENESVVIIQTLKQDQTMLISVTGQGVAPMNTSSPAQAYALAKRAAIADAYRMIAEKVKGVKIDGQDLIKNMMVKRSTIRTSVQAMVKNANVVETTFKDGLCEVEMEITLSHSDF